MVREAGSRQQPAPDSDSDSDVALRQLFDEHATSVYRVARSIVRDAALAEDVTQETFIRAWQRLDTYRGEAPIRHWLLRIAHNLAVSTLRTIRDQATDPARLPSRGGVDPDVVVEGRLMIEDALAGLDPLSRAVVVLREIEQLTYAEISEVLQVPLPTVKTRLFRARGQMRAAEQEGGRR